MDGAERIAAERQRQIEAERWGAAHDDEHCVGELAAAAAMYALHTIDVLEAEELADLFGEVWPWDLEWWKPGQPEESEADALRCLEKAGALIAAEIDRRVRAAEWLAVLSAPVEDDEES